MVKKINVFRIVIDAAPTNAMLWDEKASEKDQGPPGMIFSRLRYV